MVTESNRIFLTGMGRSLLVGKMFATRLMQMGLECYVIGEPLTPAIKEGDLLIAISGSGKTRFTVYAVEESRKRNVKIACITARESSPAARMANLVVVLPAKTKYDLARGRVPLGTMFEISALLFLDALAAYLKDILGVSEEEMLDRHAAIE